MSENSGLFQVSLKYLAALGSDGSGVIAKHYTLSDPSGSPGWGNYTNIFDEYRVLTVRLHYIPWNWAANPTYAVMSTIVNAFGGTIAVGIDRDNTTDPTGINDLLGLESCKVHPVGKEFTKTYHMNSTLEAAWADTSSPKTVGSFKLYATGLTNSTNYGQIFLEFLIQFRGAY